MPTAILALSSPCLRNNSGSILRLLILAVATWLALLLLLSPPSSLGTDRGRSRPAAAASSMSFGAATAAVMTSPSSSVAAAARTAATAFARTRTTVATTRQWRSAPAALALGGEDATVLTAGARPPLSSVAAASGDVCAFAKGRYLKDRETIGDGRRERIERPPPSRALLVVRRQLATSTAPAVALSNLTRTAVYRMKMAELRKELTFRNSDTGGSKKDLISRLLAILEEGGGVEGDEQGARPKDRSGMSMTTRAAPPSGGVTSDITMTTAIAATIESHQQFDLALADSTLGDSEGGCASADGPLLDPSRTYILQVKGASSLSSTGTGVGIVLIEPGSGDGGDGKVCWEARKYLHGNRSVFEAEYSAVVVGLRYALRRGAHRVVLQMDHDVVREQINGKYVVDKDVLKWLYWSVMNLKESMREFRTSGITPLENVKAADLANQAMATCKSMNIRDGDTDPISDQFKSSIRSGENGSDDGERKVADVSSKIGSVGDAIDNKVDQLYDDYSESPMADTTIDPSKTYLLQFDGGARGNPTGVAGAGMVLYDDRGREVWCGWKFLDKMSNNSAEYWAILLGLQCAASLGVRRIKVEGDSNLIVNQLNGSYRVRDEKLKELYKWTKAVVTEFDSFEIRHIFRKENGRADWLANHAMDTQTSHGFGEVGEDPPEQSESV